jgi:transposase
LATIIARRVKGMKEPVYYYHRTFRVKLSPADSGKGPRSGPSRVKTEDIYLGTAEQVRRKCRGLSQVQALRAKEFGLVAAALAMVRELGIVEAVDHLVPKRDQGLSVGTYVALGVIAKVCAPQVSWNGFGAWVKKTVLPEHLDLPASLLDAQNFWDHWELVLPEKSVRLRDGEGPTLDDDRVLEIEEAIWERVKDLYHVPLDCILYDTTNFFTFLGPTTAPHLARRGKNKAGRHERRQVGLALAATRALGLPLLHLVYQGHCHDAKLLPESMTRLVERVTRLNRGCQNLLLVCDKGNNSAENLARLKDLKGVHVDVVGSLVPSQHRRLLAIPVEQYSGTSGELRVWSERREVYGLPARVVMTYNEKLARRQRQTFERHLQRARAALEAYWQEHQGMKREKLIEGLERVTRQQRGGRYWKVQLDEQGRLVLRADTEARQLRYREFGKRLLFSTRLEMTPEEILQTYNRDKSQIEDDFRHLKDPDLVRFQPLRHWTDSKIRVYALIGVLALLVIQLLVYKAAQAGLGMSAAVLEEELRDIREVYLFYGPGHIQRLLTSLSAIQARLFEVLGLAAFAPQGVTPSLQTGIG